MPTSSSHHLRDQLKSASKTMSPICSNVHQIIIDHLVGVSDYSVYNRIRSHLSSPIPSLSPSPNVNLIFSKLVDILQRGPHSAAPIIEKSPQLLARAHAIAAAANEAEHKLEKYYAALLLDTPLASAQNTASLPAEQRVLAVCEAARPFPYISNYDRLVRAECALLAACARDLQSIAVVGAGPLPLTGVLMAAHFDVTVTLIDIDEHATALAADLVARWEAAGVLPQGRVHAKCADARVACFTRGHVPGAFRADVVLVCSLVPDDAKVALVRRLAGSGWDGVVGVRSAHGLTALVNYERADRHKLSEFLDYVGYVAPAACLVEGTAIGETERPIAIFPRDVLNSLDIYSARSSKQQVARRMREEVVRRYGKGVLDGTTLH